MPADVKLASLTFKTAKGFYPVASVHVKLSNNQYSQVFEREDVQFDHLKTLEFEQERPIRSIIGQSGSGGQFARTIRFRDRNDIELHKYDPANVNEFG